MEESFPVRKHSCEHPWQLVTKTDTHRCAIYIRPHDNGLCIP